MQRWKNIFLPAISILNRLGYTQKFSLVWLVSLGALVILAISLYSSLNRVIQPSLRQLEGLRILEPIGLTVQALQQHRGVSTAYSGEQQQSHHLHREAEKKLNQAISELEKNLPSKLRNTAEFQRIRNNITQLQQQHEQYTVPENIAAHTALINRIALFSLTIADEYALLQDSEISTYYLIDTIINKLPETIEALGKLRAYGTRILLKHNEAQKNKMLVLMSQAEHALNGVNENLAKISRHNTAINTKINNINQDISKATQQITQLTETHIISEKFSLQPETFFLTSTKSIDECYTQLHNELLPITQNLIQQRVTQAQNALKISLGISFLLFLCLLYFSVSMYYAIIDNIKRLSRAAHSFANGDLTARVQLDTRDELKQVANSFNDMAQGFTDMLEARRLDNARLRATVDTAMDAVILMDDHGNIIDWNAQAHKTFGWSREDVLGKPLHELIIPHKYRDNHVQGLQRFLLTGQPIMAGKRVELMALHRNGHEFPVELTIAAIKMAHSYEFSAFIRDITSKKQSDELIWKQANIDTLTDLPNRHMFYDRLAQDIKKANRSGAEIALLFIDLDKFKEVNDTLGHGVGDILLIEAAKRISQCVRETDTVARLGGDEFVVILTDMDEIRGIERVAQNILHKLTSVFQLGHEMAYISASIGITMYPNDATELEDLIKNADQAMYNSKDRGRNCFSYFTQSMQQAAQIRQRLINDLRGALAADQFRIYYQPVVDMVTGRIHKAEALIRWQHPEFGLINPDKFIPLTEETGMIVAIGDWVFREAARTLKHWRSNYDAKFQLSVNMSPVQFRDTSNLCNTWGKYLTELDLPGQSIIIEITESLLLEVEPSVNERLQSLRDANLQLAIDDFGTGYSSLSYLKKFDIDYLKIDRSFVRNLANDANDMALSEAIIVMAHKLGLKVIAEGVETQTQLNLLDSAGCDFAQGFFFSMPVSAEEFEAFF